MDTNNEIEEVFKRLKISSQNKGNSAVVGVVFKTSFEQWKEIERTIHQTYPDVYFACVKKHPEGTKLFILTLEDIEQLKNEEEADSFDTSSK